LLWTPASHFPHDKAIQEYHRALDLDPSLDEARNQLALVNSHVGLLDEALQELEKAIAVNPSNSLDDGFPCFPLFERDANLNNVRQDPRFGELLARLRGQFEWESRRDSVLQPRVGVFQPTLGTGRNQRSNPDGVASATVRQHSKPTQPFSGLRIRFLFLPGLAEKTPTLGWRTKSLRDSYRD